MLADSPLQTCIYIDLYAIQASTQQVGIFFEQPHCFLQGSVITDLGPEKLSYDLFDVGCPQMLRSSCLGCGGA